MFKCQTVPEGHNQFSMSIDGREVTRWHCDPADPRPYFYPLRGPSGSVLTRMGHPGAPNHDHHRSVWFAHEKVMGVNFWSDLTTARIQQDEWVAIQDGDAWGAFAADLSWVDGHDPSALLKQRMVATIWPDDNREYQLELQLDFEAAMGMVELMTSNFGVLAVRVAKEISGYFGGGSISCSEGRTGEADIFGKAAKWMDYSGEVSVGVEGGRRKVNEGITYFDHPSNPSFPSKWHVREDGWMGASLCRDQGITIEQGQRLRLRYLIDVHSGVYDPDRAGQLFEQFADRPEWQVSRSNRPHTHAEIAIQT